jgi:hypothetical protein
MTEMRAEERNLYPDYGAFHRRRVGNLKGSDFSSSLLPALYQKSGYVIGRCFCFIQDLSK